MRDYPLNLNAGDIKEISVTGNTWSIMEATDDVYVSVDNAPFIKRIKGQGLSYDVGVFKRLRIKSLVAQSVTIAAGQGRIIDKGTAVSVSTQANVKPGNTYSPGADVTVLAGSSAQLVAANANRLSVTITNKLSNSNTFRIGTPTTVGATVGDVLEPGESITIATTAALSAFNEGATDEALSVSEVEDI